MTHGHYTGQHKQLWRSSVTIHGVSHQWPQGESVLDINTSVQLDLPAENNKQTAFIYTFVSSVLNSHHHHDKRTAQIPS